MCCLLFCYSSNNSVKNDTNTNTNTIQKIECQKKQTDHKKNKVERNNESGEERKSFRKKISFEFLKKTLSDINLDSYIYKNMDKWIN